MRPQIVVLLAVSVLLGWVPSLSAAEPTVRKQPANGKLKIFILAGQSNMQGFGRIAGEVGTMEAYLKAKPKEYGHLVDGSGKPVVRDDVWIVNLSDGDKPRQGWLTTGYGARTEHIGPEYGFGFAVGDCYQDRVLIIKSSWGGKSLINDFLPPSAGSYSPPTKAGDAGFSYAEVPRHYREVTSNLKKYYPDYDGKGFELVGFGWHQGWNDRINQKAVDAYEANLVHLIKDLRRDLGVADMPFVVANTGMGGWETAAGSRPEKLMLAQLAVADPAKHPEFKGTVAGVETRGFQRPQAESPSKQGYHWLHNWETYYLIGKGMGDAMVKLLSEKAK